MFLGSAGVFNVKCWLLLQYDIRGPAGSTKNNGDLF